MNTLNELQIGAVRPSKTNPRKDFASAGAVAYLNEMAATIRQKGVLQPILVRPEYCIGTNSRAQIEKARGAVLRWEIIAGECRWRASKIGERTTIPAIVSEMTDDDAREAQQIENLQRRDLTPREEAQGVAAMLSLKDDAGKLRYTKQSLAEKLGRSPGWVYKCEALLSLPDNALQALDSGVLTAKVASLIGAVPEPKQRAEFARRILKPEIEEGPLSWQKARDLRDEHYVKTLKGAPFSLDDAELVKAAGACAACPKMSGNRPDLFEGDESAAWKRNTCLDPACYRSKIAALQARALADAEKAGKKMLPGEEAAKIYPFYMNSGEMDPKSPYVQIGRKPAEHLLKKEVQKHQIGTWAEFIEAAEKKTGAKVTRVLIADQDGVVREHVDVKLAIAAIEKAGEPIFRSAGERHPPGIGDSFAIQKKAEADRSKVQWAIAKASLDAVWAALQKGWDSEAVWDALFYISMTHAGDNGLGAIMKWQGLVDGGGEFGKADAVEKWWHSLKGDNARDAVIPLLLVSLGVKHHGASAEDFVNLARALKVDLGAVEKKAVAEFKEKEKCARLKPAELEAKIREMLREKRTPVEIALALGLSIQKCGRILDRIEKENAAASVTMDPKVLSQWIRAEAGGMSHENIAATYKVPLADVKGALSSRKPPAGKKGAKKK